MTTESIKEQVFVEKVALSEHQLEQLIYNYGDELLRLCTLYLKDRHLAEDAMQDVFIKVWKSYVTYRGDAHEKTWLTRIAINVCKNYLRNSWQQKRSDLDVNELLAQSKDTFQCIDNSIDLVNGILNLKEKYRMVILLYYYQQLSVKEISTILSKKESTILSLLRRGREQLKKQILDFE